MVSTGLRTSPMYRNQGLVHGIKLASLEKAKSNFLGLKTERSAVVDSMLYDKYRGPNPKRIRIVFERVRTYRHSEQVLK